MQNDDVTWSIIGKHHCSYKIKTETQSFCRNEYNVTGLCNRKACPLANSQYATVREQKGILYLYIRQSERVYKPSLEWQKVKLSKTFIKALQQIEDNLVFWPQYFRQKCRQRVLKITQYLARMRKMQLHDTKKVVPVRRKEERRLAKREEKALVAAKLDHAIEKQLLERLKEGTYERIYNFPKKAFNVRLDAEEELEDEEELEEVSEGEEETVEVKEEEEEEEEEEMDEELRKELNTELVRQRRERSESGSDDDDEEEEEDGSDEDDDEVEEDMESEEEEEEDEGQVEYVADFDESDEEPLDDIEDAAAMLRISKSVVDKLDEDSSDEERSDQIRRKKYGPQKPVKPSSKFGIKRMQNKQRLRQIYEREKAAASKDKNKAKLKR